MASADVSWAICVSSATRIGVRREGLDCVGIGFDRAAATRVDRKDWIGERRARRGRAHRDRRGPSRTCIRVHVLHMCCVRYY